jgi:hypothetical protein
LCPATCQRCFYWMYLSSANRPGKSREKFRDYLLQKGIKGLIIIATGKTPQKSSKIFDCEYQKRDTGEIVSSVCIRIEMYPSTDKCKTAYVYTYDAPEEVCVLNCLKQGNYDTAAVCDAMCWKGGTR